MRSYEIIKLVSKRSEKMNRKHALGIIGLLLISVSWLQTAIVINLYGIYVTVVTMTVAGAILFTIIGAVLLGLSSFFEE